MQSHYFQREIKPNKHRKVEKKKKQMMQFFFVKQPKPKP